MPITSFRDLENRYQQLARQHARGSIDEQAFIEAVNGLRLTDDDGRWWQLEAGTGRWLCWNGQSWQPASPPVTPTAGSEGAQAPAAADRRSAHSNASRRSQESRARNDGDHPQPKVQAGAVSLAALPGLLTISWTAILKQTVLGIPLRLFTAVKAAIVAWFVHTYLMAVPNGGFQDGSWAGKFIASDGYADQAVYSWAAGGAFLWFVWSKLRASGFVNGIRQALALPATLAPHFRQAQKPNFVALGAGVVMGYYISGYFAMQTQLAVSFWSLTTLGTAFPMLLAGPVMGLVTGVTRFIPPDTLPTGSLGKIAWPSVIQVGCLGLAAGLFSQARWEWASFVTWAILLGSVGAILTQGGKATPVSPRMSMFLGIGLTAVAWCIGHDQPLWADDGGWSEGINRNDPLHKQLISWVQSEGATETMKRGIPPAISAGAGAAAVDSGDKVTVYCLQVNTHEMSVSSEQPGELLAAVWKSENGGPTVAATDASVSITSDGSQWLTLSNAGGGWRVTCLVGQNASAPLPAGQAPAPAWVTVTGSGGGQTCTASVCVTPGDASQYVLEVY
ncbi:MAG TPA: hypothetical protein PLP29_06705 [Candidatus Ozemobacteraceae bacterium]|mgnify:CR=1 FL=1|nr:hypothetical protein [Candidatus Ozemobacteraceae bacterium]